ncbi:MAG: PHP domain-containing protein [Armatimonadota bacterium]
MAVDLHIHSTASDGTHTPEEIVATAISMGLTAIALADHDTTVGTEAALAAAEGTELIVIPAVEINTEVGRKDVHILGYHIDCTSSALQSVLASIREKRLDRGERIVKRLRNVGVDLDMSLVQEHAKGAAIARPHIAAALCSIEVCKTSQEAFDRFLKRDRPAFVQRYKLSPQEAVQAVLDADGVPVAAHPGLTGDDALICGLVPAGLRGLEAYHVDHWPRATERYLALAQELDLIVTGGTDSHGPLGPKRVRIGSIPVPDEVLAPLKAAAQRQRASAAELR